MSKIQDGKGKNGDMSVSVSQRGNVSSKTARRKYYVSRDDGRVYNAVFDPVNAAAGDYTAYLKNTSSSRNLYVSVIEFHSVEATEWRLWAVSGTAAAGELVTPTNLNLSKSIPAEAIAMAGNVPITGLTNIAQIGSHRSPVLGDSDMDFEGALILGPSDAIAVELQSGTTGDVSHDLFFWFETIGAT